MALPININPEKCRGCRRCEVACSWTPSGRINPRLAGIRIWKDEGRGRDYPVINQQCLDNFCGKEHPARRGWDPVSGRPLETLTFLGLEEE